MKLHTTVYMSAIVATLLVGCGGGSSSADTNLENQSNSAQTQPANTGNNTNSVPALVSNSSTTSTPVGAVSVQCKSIMPTLSLLEKQYSTELTLQRSYKESDEEEEDESKERDHDGEDKKDKERDKDDTDKEKEDKGSSDDKENDEGEEGEGSRATGIHNQGKACLKCHSFASGVTVFARLNAPTKSAGATGYKIQLGNSYVYNAGRGSGNSNLVRYSGGKYTANVIDANGNIVNSSANMSHDASRLDCNRCHTASGANGAPGRIVNKRISASNNAGVVAVVPAAANATTCVSFSKNVMPILSAKCKSCHGSNGRFSIGSTNATYANIGGLKSPMTSAAQYLIGKGSNSIGHGGGRVISTSSNEYKTIKAWITEGALNN